MIKLDSLKEYCELFDCTVLQDRENTNDTYPSYKTVLALGFHPELDVGIYGSSLTPYFPSETKLLAYCQSPEGWQQLNSEGLAMFGNDWQEIIDSYIQDK